MPCRDTTAGVQYKANAWQVDPRACSV